jgi:hypothetical protein
MIIRKITWILLAASMGVAIPACKKDSNLKASKTDCDDACTHIVALNSGKKDLFTRRCPRICVDKEWTVGDTKCVNDAKTIAEAKDCGAAAKAVMDLKEIAARRGHRRGKGRRNRGGDEAPGADQAKTAAPGATAPAHEEE